MVVPTFSKEYAQNFDVPFGINFIIYIEYKEEMMICWWSTRERININFVDFAFDDSTTLYTGRYSTIARPISDDY